MSRIGKLPVPIPQGVKVEYAAPVIKVTKGQVVLTRSLHQNINLTVEKERLLLTPKDESPSNRALWGLTRTLVNNMVIGVSTGFKKVLEVVGVGWRVEAQENKGLQILKLTLGFSHPVEFPLPPAVKAEVDAKTLKITLTSPDKELLGMTAAKVRAFRKPEPYKGKGVRYEGETIRRKVGKAGKAGGK